jgi:hypothetical protein
MPCSFGLLPHRRPEADPHRPGPVGVTVTDRYIPLVTAAYGTRVARPARTRKAAAWRRPLPAHLLGEARPRWLPPRGQEPGGLAAAIAPVASMLPLACSRRQNWPESGSLWQSPTMWPNQHGLKKYLNIVLVIAILAIFPAFFLLRRHPETIATLASAGTVVAACFAAMAAVASMKAANESSITATRAREALARSLRPALTADVHFTESAAADGKVPALGRVMSASSNAVDVVVEWHLENGASRVGRTARLESWRPNLPSGSDISFGVDLGDD